jgi:predicted metalloendopeptidase
MYTSWTPINSAISLAVCAAAFAINPDGASAQAAAPGEARPAAMTMLPGDDFYSYVNGQWMASTEIPADRSGWGAGAVLVEQTNARIVKLIADIPNDKQASAEARKVAAFYHAFMDAAAIEAQGGAPLKPMLAKIDAIKDKADLTRALGGSLRADVDPLNATNFFTENLFGVWVAQALSEPTRNVPYILQGGLGMPERAYYLTDSPKMADLRRYRSTSRPCSTGRLRRQRERAARVFALETEIARSHASREDSADVLKANNSWTLKDFTANAPGIDWPALFRAARLGGQNKFIVWHPGAVKGAATLVAGTGLATWKDFLAFHQINHLRRTCRASSPAFRAPTAPRCRARRSSRRAGNALNATNAALDQPVGRLYEPLLPGREQGARGRW